MFTSSSRPSPPPTPRFRSLDAAQEPLILPRHQGPERLSRSFLKRPTWLSRSQLIQLGVLSLLLFSVWGILSVFTSPMDVLSRPLRLHAPVPVVDINTISEINATIIHGNGVDAAKWTVAVPAGIRAPLRPSVYSGICRSAHEVSSMARSHGDEQGHGAGHHNYYWVDDLFVDPADSGEYAETEQGKDICDTSLTYMLESSNAGFGVALMGLWSAYGLAKGEGRAFFVNDRDWYLSHSPRKRLETNRN